VGRKCSTRSAANRHIKYVIENLNMRIGELRARCDLHDERLWKSHALLGCQVQSLYQRLEPDRITLGSTADRRHSRMNLIELLGLPCGRPNFVTLPSYAGAAHGRDALR
jgi:hypothetical protein